MRQQVQKIINESEAIFESEMIENSEESEKLEKLIVELKTEVEKRARGWGF